jgi:hypothetical protein
LIKEFAPVIFPPGWLRLLTSPSSTGSAPITKTIGMVAVAAFAAAAAAGRREPRNRSSQR